MSEPKVIHIPAIDGETEEACAARVEAALLSRGIDPGSLVPICSEHGQIGSPVGPIIVNGTFYDAEALCGQPDPLAQATQALDKG